ncbi:MAG: arsenite efflux transporter metallochaperone ArsD [Pirellulaceae bacterium]
MALLQVFDPPMCCSSGVCGPQADASLTQFAADLEWLQGQGVVVRRYNLAQEPRFFVEHELVKIALAKSGEKCLPILLVDGEIIAEGAYPSREEMAVLVSIATTTGDSLYARGVEELVAIGAAIGANCASCFEYHFREARKAGVGRDDIALAVSTARKVKEAAAGEIVKMAGRHLAAAAAEESLKTLPCCTPAAGTSAGKCC